MCGHRQRRVTLRLEPPTVPDEPVAPVEPVEPVEPIDPGQADEPFGGVEYDGVLSLDTNSGNTLLTPTSAVVNTNFEFGDKLEITLPDDISVGTGNVFINARSYLTGDSAALSWSSQSSLPLKLTENGDDAIQWNTLSGGDVLLIRRDFVFMELAGVNPISQSDVDNYDAQLSAYNVALSAYNVALSQYNTAIAEFDDLVADRNTAIELLAEFNNRYINPGHVIRGTFTKTPRIDTAEPPTVPDEPVAPTGTSVEPVNPGPVSDGFPTSDTTPVISSYTPLGPFSISALNPSNGGSLIEQYWAVDTPEYIPDEQLVIVDFSNFDRRAMADDDVIRLNLTLSPTTGSLSLFNYFYRDSIPGYGEGSNANYIRAKTIVDAIADGRPFAVLHHTSADATTMRSGFVASVDDIPTFGTIPGIIDTNDAVATYAADATGVEDFGAIGTGEMTRNNANLSNENYSAAIKDALYDGFNVLPEYSYVRMVIDENLSNADILLSGGQLVIANGDDTQELRYNITFQQPGNPGTLKYHTSQPPVTINDGPLEHLWLVTKQPEGDDAGTIYYRDTVSTNTTQWDTALPELEAFIAANTVTQDQVDAYLLALANFNGDLQAQQAEYDDLVADRNTAIALLAAYNARGDVLTRADDLPLDDMHVPALEEFALYYAYAIDDDVTANSGRAQRHWLAFFQLINKAEDATLMINQAREVTE